MIRRIDSARLAPLAALAAVVLLSSGCGVGTGGLAEAGDASRGKELFSDKCAQCHVLKDANAQGRVGPNLDAVFGGLYEQDFAESTIRQIVADQIKYAGDFGTEGPTMPRNLVKGDDVDAVATYVAAVAGKGGAGGTAAPGGAGTTQQTTTQQTTTQQTTTGGTETTAQGGQASDEGRQLFKANCSPCHTLEDAGATGNVGPNLDQITPTEQRVNEQIHNGGGGMPPFKGVLTEPQIDTLAKYVVAARKSGK